MSEVEFRTVSLPVTEELNARVQELAKEGWAVAPGSVPTITYNLVRTKAPGTGVGLGVLQIDDSKVEVVKAGQQD